MTEPVLPDYGGACIDSVVPALLRWRRPAPDWLPEPARDVRQVVLLVLDGLGWDQLREHAAAAPVLASMAGGPITSVAPTTTSAALTSISTGRPPAEHGVVGYRVHVGGGRVMNVLRWRTGEDARETVPPAAFQPLAVFDATSPPVVSRSAFAATGFTEAHLGGVRLHGWRTPSSLVVEVRSLLRAGEPFVYAYYDGIDKVAHEFGLEAHYQAELGYADRLVGDVLAELPPGAALVVVSDHGQVDVGDRLVALAPEVAEEVAFTSGEGRFRWLHARPGADVDRLAATAAAAHGDTAWVRTRAQAVEEGWFGGCPSPVVADRLGDVALVAHAPVSFLDPSDPAETRLRSRHGSLTPAEMWVPLLAG